jgi:hypothetical protein
MTGLQLFVRLNANLARLGQEAITTRTAHPTFDALTPQNMVMTNAAGVVAIKLTCPTSAGETTGLRAWAPLPFGRGEGEASAALGVVYAADSPVSGSFFVWWFETPFLGWAGLQNAGLRRWPSRSATFLLTHAGFPAALASSMGSPSESPPKSGSLLPVGPLPDGSVCP